MPQNPSSPKLFPAYGRRLVVRLPMSLPDDQVQELIDQLEAVERQVRFLYEAALADALPQQVADLTEIEIAEL